MYIPVFSMTLKGFHGVVVGMQDDASVVSCPPTSTDNDEMLSAMAKLAGEIDESASDVVVCDMVR